MNNLMKFLSVITLSSGILVSHGALASDSDEYFSMDDDDRQDRYSSTEDGDIYDNITSYYNILKQYSPSQRQALLAMFYLNTVLLSAESDTARQIQWDCRNQTENCYPFWYGNKFLDAIAILNAFSGYVVQGVTGLAAGLVIKTNQEMEDYVKKEMAKLTNNVEYLHKSLAQIITEFKNGLDDETAYFTVRGVLETLNNRACMGCIEEFANIVSAQDGMSEREVKKAFKKLYQSLYRGECYGHDFEPVDLYVGLEKSNFEKIKHAFGSKLHLCGYPSWIVSTASTFTALTLAYLMVIYIENPALAGSFIGDVANMANAVVFPTGPFVAAFIHRSNKDKAQGKKLNDHIEHYLASINSHIETYAKVVGKIDNGINEQETRGILKVLFLTGFQEDPLASFVDLASNKSGRTFNDLVEEIKVAYEEQGCSYTDEDIEYIFERRRVYNSESSSIGIEIVDTDSSSD